MTGSFVISGATGLDGRISLSVNIEFKLVRDFPVSRETERLDALSAVQSYVCCWVASSVCCLTSMNKLVCSFQNVVTLSYYERTLCMAQLGNERIRENIIIEEFIATSISKPISKLRKRSDSLAGVADMSSSASALYCT